jgi:acyl-CoA synthetase (AMP-forming)/AMP-acid ligase II
MSLALILEMAAAGDSGRVAIGSRHGGGTTYAELQQRAGVGARALVEGDTREVAYLGTSGLSFAVTLFASVWAGVPFVPVNYRLGSDQLDGVLGALDGALVIADATSAPGVQALGQTALDADEWLRSTDVGKAAPASSIDDSEIAIKLYTSGTTSAPKAAILRHRHLLAYLFGTVAFGAADPREATLVSVPPYHVAGVTNLLSNVYAGRRIVYLDAFTPAAWLRTARDEEVTHAMLVPTMLARIVDELDAGGTAVGGAPPLRSISYGGARMPAPVIERALRLFPETDFVNGYGLTETSSTIAVLGPEDHRAALHGDAKARLRLQSAGRIIDGIEAEVRGEDGRVLPDGEAGELWVRGEQISGEYVGATHPEGGWLATRDRAWLDADGFLFIEGRADDTIIRGGENIAPAEIEDVLLAHAAVAEAAVVGLADEEWGQRIAAAIVVRSGAVVEAGELSDWTRARLRSSKTPDVIVQWPELPYTNSGKLLRREVRTRLERSLD